MEIKKIDDEVVELDGVRYYKKELLEVIRDTLDSVGIEIFTQDDIENSHDQGMSDGHDSGYDQGYDEGYDKGYTDGYNEAKQEDETK